VQAPPREVAVEGPFYWIPIIRTCISLLRTMPCAVSTRTDTVTHAFTATHALSPILSAPAFSHLHTMEEYLKKIQNVIRAVGDGVGSFASEGRSQPSLSTRLVMGGVHELVNGWVIGRHCTIAPGHEACDNSPPPRASLEIGVVRSYPRRASRGRTLQ
jgi:hypothetical protein